MKRIFSIFLAAVYLLVFAVNACCIDIDGADGKEWRDAEVKTLFKGESNGNVSFASVKWIKDEAVNIVYFSFQFHEENITVSEKSSSGMILKVNNSEPVRVICDESTAEYHSDLYSISGAGTRNENNGSNCEFKVGFKQGIPTVINAEVTFIDSEGNNSNLYEFSVEGVAETEAETNPLPSVNNVIESMISDITTAEKTTKKVVKTTKAAEKTTKKKKETTTKKASTTKRRTKTSKSAENTTAVTESVTEVAVIITDTNTQTASAPFLQTSISSSEGKKYKYITMGAGVAALVLVSVLGVSAANKKAKENDPKS